MQIVRWDRDGVPETFVDPEKGFETGARAFAYDPSSKTVYTTTGHHPDIVEKLYSTDLYSENTTYENKIDLFSQAAEQYL